MNKDDKREDIDNRCRMHGCDPKLAKEHAHLFTTEHWDPHPPQEFCDWLKRFNPTMPYLNPATAWNSNGDQSGGFSTTDRPAYYEWIRLGRPEPVHKHFNREESKAKFRAAMAQIESRFSRGHEPVVVEDNREHGYDVRQEPF